MRSRMRWLALSLTLLVDAASAEDAGALRGAIADTFVSKLADRALQRLPSHSRADFDGTTLEKSGVARGSGASHATSIVSMPPARLHRAPFAAPRSQFTNPRLPFISHERFPLISHERCLPMCASSNPSASTTLISKLQGQFVKQFLPIALTLSAIVGVNYPSFGQGLAAIKIGNMGVVSTFCVCYIFFIQGASLKLDQAKKAFTEIKPLLYGVATITFLSPLMSIPIGWMTFMEHEFRTGFVLFYNMATALGQVLNVASGGNLAFGLLLTVITNVLGIFTIPLYLSAFMAGSGEVRIDPFPILRELLAMTLVPTFLGKAATAIPGVADFVARSSKLLGLTTQASLAIIPLLKISQSVESIRMLRPESVMQVSLVAIGLHYALLAWNWVLTGPLNVALDLRKTLIVLGTMKTLPTAMAVLALLPASLGSAGKIAIPCLIGHFAQLVSFSFIVQRMATWTMDNSTSAG